MTNDTADRSSVPSPTVPPPPVLPGNDDDLGIDRAFVLQMAQVPVIALILLGLAWASHQLWPLVATTETNYGPIVVLCAGMILAAIIDGWAFKVPNWLTLSFVLSGWGLGLLHSLEVPIDAGTGGIGSSLMCTALGFALLFPVLAIGGMGQGDVKMQMGFGAWVGAFWPARQGLETVLFAFCLGAIVGGVFGLIIMVLRRRFGSNADQFREIFTDLQILMSQGPAKAAERANARRPTWVRLPYGVPLCVGFLGWLWYSLVLVG